MPHAFGTVFLIKLVARSCFKFLKEHLKIFLFLKFLVKAPGIPSEMLASSINADYYWVFIFIFYILKYKLILYFLTSDKKKVKRENNLGKNKSLSSMGRFNTFNTLSLKGF